MPDEKDKLSEALRRAQEERDKNAKRNAPPLNSEYVAPIVPQKIEAAKNGIDARMVTYTDPKSRVAEQYRSLVTYLLSMPEAATLKIITITSSSPQEGKTITSLNLGIILAQDLEKKVLVIDCNLRKPAVDVYLGIGLQRGLSDILAGVADISEVVVETSIKNLFCICAGHTETSPTELLSSPKMKELLVGLRRRFDYIILDTPAVIPYADPRITGKISDGVLLVVKAEKTRREVVNRSEALLKAVGAKVLGIALTNVQYHIPEYIHKHL